MSQKTKITMEDIENIVKEKGYKLLPSVYINSDSKISIEDEYGYKYTIRPYNLKVGIRPNIFDIRNPYTIHNIEKWCILNQKSFRLISTEFTGYEDILEWKCLNENCGEIFYSPIDRIKRGAGCQYCLGRIVGRKNSLEYKFPNVANEWNYELNKDKHPSDISAISGERVWWKCSKNPEHIWQTRIADRTNKPNGCPFCSGRKRSTDNNFFYFFPELCEEWDYDKNANAPNAYAKISAEKVWWKCKKCQTSWEATLQNRAYGTGCPKCKKSKGEIKVEEILRKNNIKYEWHYKDKKLKSKKNRVLEFDFAILNQKQDIIAIIEYDGIFHYYSIPGVNTYEDFVNGIENDILKNEYCENRNIPILRIPYYQYKQIEDQIKNFMDKIEFQMERMEFINASRQNLLG